MKKKKYELSIRKENNCLTRDFVSFFARILNLSLLLFYIKELKNV